MLESKRNKEKKGVTTNVGVFIKSNVACKCVSWCLVKWWDALTAGLSFALTAKSQVSAQQVKRNYVGFWMQPSLTWEESQGIMWPIRCWHYLFSQEFLISVAGIRSNWICLFFHAPKDTTLSGTLWTFWSCERVYLFHFWNENVIGHKPYLMKYLKYLMWHPQNFNSTCKVLNLPWHI